METAVHSGRREERVPLDALIELRSDDGAEVLEADGLDLSSGGLAMRAAFVPPVGAKLKCQFRCSPEGERVRAEGEVVWSHWQGDRDGAFGMRFLELDTKSATAIRHHMEPEPWQEPAEPEAPPVANMRIDGVGAPVETDVLYVDAGSIVLEQQLDFLKLGRGVAIDVPGRGPLRGRIGSVELRHGALDVPTLVFGILLDGEAEVREVVVEAPVAVAPPAVEWAPPPAAAPVVVHAEPEVRAVISAPAPRQAEPAREREGKPAAAREKDAVGRTRAQPEPAESSESVVAASAAWGRLSGLMLAFKAWLLASWSRVVPAFQAFVGSFRGQTSQLREAHWPEAKSKLAVTFARLRLLVASQKARFVGAKKAASAKRATAPAPRVQRSSAGAPRATAEAPRKPKQGGGSRWLAIGLALVGIALGVYALAPRSGADRIRVRHEPAPAASAPAALEEAIAATSQLAPTLPVAAAQAPLESAVVDPSLAAAPSASLSFGEASVPNGRTFALRMSGPVESVEGESREDGFTVRVPGRLALDRASPIATSHRAVARAMILNRGDYAELTVDFLPGLRPKYQVVGKDAAIEVTLERL